MKKLFPFFLLVALISCYNADLSTFTFKSVNWEVKVPKNIEILNVSTIDSLAKTGTEFIDKEKRTKTNTEDVKSLIGLKLGELNIMGATISPHNSEIFKSEKHFFNSAKKLMFQSLQGQKAVQIIDTISSLEKIGGKTFNTLYIKSSYPNNNIKLETYWFYKKVNSYDLSINVAFKDSKAGKQLLEIVKSSSFK